MKKFNDLSIQGIDEDFKVGKPTQQQL
jgi:hypothetical protein